MAVVKMQDGSEYVVTKLLADGDSNTKLRKSNAAGTEYFTASLSLSPANESGYETCASRSPGCTKACLFTAGYGVYESVKKARIAKTRLFFQDREQFLKMLYLDISRFTRKAEKQGKKLALRLNVVSDIAWEKVVPEMFTDYPDVQFYDYTKHVKRALSQGKKNFPKNYHLTFSRSEVNDFQVNSLIATQSPTNIAVVFSDANYPDTFLGREVINGDETDLRFLDGYGKIVGLYAKGKGKKDESGFVVDTRLSLPLV